MKNYPRVFWGMLVLTLMPLATVSAYDLPRQDAKTKFFYIFGPDGNPLDGKEASNEFSLYFDVPESASDPLVLKIFDPETGGQNDRAVQPWNTEIEFTVTGAQELDQRTFGVEDKFDQKFFQFGPYEKTQGEKVGDQYRFTLKVRGVSGDDLNAFYVRVKPDSTEAWSDKFTFFLLPTRGEKIYFYPEVPAGTQKLVVKNFDLDKDGGVSKLVDPVTRESYPIQDSESGQWADTEMTVSGTEGVRFQYVITTTDQTHGHAGVQILDEKGAPIPIYFKKGKAPAPRPKPAPAPQKPVLACNQFTFDARKSYDAESKDISYLWDFGDGTTSTEPVVTHVYEKGGAYDVTLTVSDHSGLNCEKNTSATKVEVNTPPAASLKAPELACAGAEVVLDAGGTQDDDPSKMTYAWNFGDGTSGEGESVKKVYAKGGTYKITLNVNDGSGSRCATDAAAQTIRINTPPIADAGKDVSMCLRGRDGAFEVELDGSDSRDPDGDALEYLWDFGDGSSGEGAKVSHAYEKPGTYAARLTVADGSGAGCDRDTSSVNVDLNRSPVAAAGPDQSICAGDTVQLDASGSQVEGDSAEYVWDFGDGEGAKGRSAEHRYEKGGTYRVRLTVDDGKQTQCSAANDTLTVRVNSAPSVTLSGVEAACAGDKVSFSASSEDADGDKLRYTWDFGDGAAAEGGSSVSHTYEKGGDYTVRVTVSDGSEQSCSTASDSVRVKVNSRPLANAGPNLVCCTEEDSPFDASESSDPDGDRLSYRWDFGDGASSTEVKTSHAYASSGTYKVVLSVDDGSGTRCATDSASFTAQVNSQPVAVIEIKQK